MSKLTLNVSSNVSRFALANKVKKGKSEKKCYINAKIMTTN